MHELELILLLTSSYFTRNKQHVNKRLSKYSIASNSRSPVLLLFVLELNVQAVLNANFHLNAIVYLWHFLNVLHADFSRLSEGAVRAGEGRCHKVSAFPWIGLVYNFSFYKRLKEQREIPYQPIYALCNNTDMNK